jgi:hypothetical protein
MEKEDVDLGCIRDARQRRIPWNVVAQKVAEIERSSPLDQNQRPWIQVCAEVSGFTVNQIRKFQATERIFAKKTKINPKWNLDGLAHVPFAVLETVGRISIIDQEIADDLLEKARMRLVTYYGLLDILREIRQRPSIAVGPVAAGRQAAVVLRQACRKLLNSSNIFRFDPQKLIEVRSVRAFPSPDFLFIDINSFGMCAIDIVDVRKYDKDSIILNVVLPARMKSSFFDNFFLVCVGDGAGYVWQRIEQFGQKNIHVVSVVDDISKVEHVWEGKEMPDPDWRSIWINEAFRRLKKRIGDPDWSLYDPLRNKWQSAYNSAWNAMPPSDLEALESLTRFPPTPK